MRTLFFISFILFGKLHAQTFQLDNWNQQNGAIGNNTIQAIEIDHLGNTWVGTDFGLHIFNGQEWETVTTANSSISSNQIRSITFDNLNQPWVGTFNHGITYFNSEEWINFSTENSPLPDNFIKDLKFDLNNNLWIASTGGLAKKENDEWRIWNTSNTEMWTSHMSCILVDKNNNDKYIGTMNGGLILIKGDTLHSIEKSTTHGIPDNTIYGLAFANPNELWVVAPSGGLMIRYSAQLWLWYNAENSDLPSSSYNAIQIGEKTFLGSQNAGIVIYDNESYSVVNKFNSNLETNEITKLKLSEDENHLWIGTSANGLYRLALNETANVNDGNRLSQITIYPNPTRENFTISNYSGQLSIYSIEGRLLAQTQINENAQIDLHRYPSGIYVLKTNEKEFKIVKQ